MGVLESFSLQNRTVVITGATSGAGRAIAIACAEAGAVVAGIGRNPERLAALQNDLSKVSDRPHWAVPLDITDYRRIPETVAAIVGRCGRIGGLVHCAGINTICPLNALSPEAYEKIYSVNVIAGFEFARAIARKQNVADHASMLFIASAAGLRGAAGMLAYSSSKGAVMAGVRSLAMELSGKGVRVNALAPGYMTDTEMGKELLESLPENTVRQLESRHLLGWGNSQALTGTAVYFLSPAAWWVTGSVLTVDGGFCL